MWVCSRGHRVRFAQFALIAPHGLSHRTRNSKQSNQCQLLSRITYCSSHRDSNGAKWRLLLRTKAIRPLCTECHTPVITSLYVKNCHCVCVCVCVCCTDDKWPLHLLRARSKATLIFSFPSFQGNIVRKGKVCSQQIHTNTHTCTVFFSDHTHQICKSEGRHRHKQLWPHVLTWDLVSVITWRWFLFHFYFISHLVCELNLEIYKH